MGRRRTIIYRTEQGAEPYSDFIDSLGDRRSAAKIDARVKRAEWGNLGDHRGVGHGVIEMRIHFGPGYRVHVGLQGEEIIVLLCAGDKSTQVRDIHRAVLYWQDYRGRA